MFKKHVSVSGTHSLGGKDVKKLKATIAKHYPSLTEDQLAELWPKGSAFVQSKLTNRCTVYGTEDTPYFFDPNGHNDRLLPTVYLLSLLPSLVSTLHTWSEVSSKLLGGADLFLQGVLAPTEGLEPFLAGSVRSVAVPGNPVPFAVGTMAVSTAEARREGMKGRGLMLLHSYGDLLWALGPKTPPNAGFTVTRVFPIESDAAQQAQQGGNVDESACREAGDKGVEAAAGAMAALEVGDAAASASFEGDSGAGEGSAAGVDGGFGSGGGNEGEGGSELDMDALLEAAVLGGLTAVKNAELPLMTSDFWQKHVLPLRPPGVTLDFKKATKYKKLSKLLDKYEKAKVLAQKQIRKQDHISLVNRTHPLLANWSGMPHGFGGNGAGTGSASPAGAAPPGMAIELLYRPPTSLRSVFGDPAAGDKDRLFSEVECREALLEHARGLGKLVEGDRAVVLDHTLASGLWGKKEGPEEGAAVPIAVLFPRFMSKLQQWHRISRPSLGGGGGVVEVLRKGAVKQICIVAERKNGRNLTSVTRVEGFGWAADELAADFQKRFKTAASVAPLPGKTETDKEIMMQGDMLKQATKFFTETAGIDAKFLELNNKMKK